MLLTTAYGTVTVNKFWKYSENDCDFVSHIKQKIELNFLQNIKTG